MFAASTTEQHVGYALTADQVAPDVHQGVGRTAPVSTQGCTE